MKTNDNRLLRVGENIRAILSKHIISNELYIKHLKNVIVTITEVRPSKDLKHARVYVSSIGGNAEKVANAGVTRESGFLYFIDKNGHVARSPMARGRK